MSKSFKSLDELKQFVISEKIANYEKQKEVSKKLFATLEKAECVRCGQFVTISTHPEIGCDL